MALKKNTLGRACAIALIASLAILSPHARAAVAALADDQPYSDCRLYAQGSEPTDLKDFNPALTYVPLKPLSPSLKDPMVLCFRKTIRLALYDFRILAEMGAPLAIKTEDDRAIFLGQADNRLSLSWQMGQAKSPAEAQEIQSELTSTQAALATWMYTARKPKIDLAKAYAPSDLALLEGSLAATGFPEAMSSFAVDMADHINLDGCPAGTKAAFPQVMVGHIVEQASAIRYAMAAEFDPPFTHQELIDIARLQQLSPMRLVPGRPTNLPDAPKLSPDEEKESERLGASAAVRRFASQMSLATIPAMAQLGGIGTGTLHEMCPAQSAQVIRSTGPQ